MNIHSNRAAFTLVEVMVATVLGLMAITAVYAIGAQSSRRFRSTGPNFDRTEQRPLRA